MRVKRLNSNKEILINTRKYAIDWKNDGVSSLERRFRDLIKPYWEGRYIVLYQCPVAGSLLRLDFVNCNKRLAIEIEGSQHFEKYNKFFNKGSRANYLASIKRDMTKVKWCAANNINLLELIEEDLDLFSPDYIWKKFNVNIL